MEYFFWKFGDSKKQITLSEKKPPLKSVWIPSVHDIVKFPKVCKLKLLLMSNCRIQQDFTKKMLESCHSLQKLALLGCILNPEILKKICCQNGQSLQVSMTSLLTHNVAHSTRHSFRPKPRNQSVKKFFSLAIS